jgi:hypothetical protein
MDLPATELFVEILIEGLLLAFAVSPILFLYYPAVRGLRSAVPAAVHHGESKIWITLTVLLAVAFVYSVGVAGNRVVDSLFRVVLGNPSDCLEQAAYVLRHESAASLEWVERHKSYLKILRAALAASVLYLLSMGVHQAQHRHKGDVSRYAWRHAVGTLLLLGLFSGGYSLEQRHYYRDVFRNFQLSGAPAPVCLTSSRWIDRLLRSAEE